MAQLTARRIRRLILGFALLATAAILARAPLPVAQAAAPPGAKGPSVVMQAFRQNLVVGSGPNRAALVFRYGDGSVQTRCVEFPETEIGGDELLNRSGVNPGFGPSMEVCSINGDGCPTDDCFCQCPFPNCEYWAYYHLKNGAWQYSSLGAADSVIKDGDVDGWSWGPGNFTQGTEPPVRTFDEICPSTAATATPTRLAPPQVTFLALASSVQPGQCTALSWQTTNATTVLLDGVSVSAQESQQVCPTATQTWTLIAANAAGQTTRQLTVQVAGGQTGSGQQATATPTATTAPAGGGAAASPTAPVYATPDAARPGMATPAYLTPLPPAIVTQAPRVIPQPAQVGGLSPTPAVGLSPIRPDESQLVGGVPLAPTAEPLPQEPVAQGPLPTPTRFIFDRPPTETPRPRRILGEAGRATPTPILLARVGAAPAGGAAAAAKTGATAAERSTPGALLQSRAFSAELFPQYAAYLATLTVLLAMGWVVRRRRSPAAAQAAVAQAERGRGEGRAGREDRATQ